LAGKVSGPARTIICRAGGNPGSLTMRGRMLLAVRLDEC
jgi:hypothetical protein